MLLTRDEDPFKKSRWIGEKYARQLRQVAREIARSFQSAPGG